MRAAMATETVNKSPYSSPWAALVAGIASREMTEVTLSLSLLPDRKSVV